MGTARLGTIALALLLTVSGCADEGAGLEDCGEAGPCSGGEDGGTSTRGDGGLVAPESADGVPGVCYDELDNDGNGVEDCDETGCSLDPVCCVGSGLSACCASTDTFSSRLEVPAASCDDASVELCTELEGYAFFGDGTPRIEAGALIPQGGLGHGGVVLSQALDPRAGNLTLTGTIEVPAADARCSDCIDAAGIALLREIPAPGLPAEVVVGMLASGSRGQALLYVEGEVIARVDLPVGASELRIELLVDGTLRFVPPAGDAIVVEADDLGPLIPTIFGRTDNRAGEPAVGVKSASVSVRACDTPGALQRPSIPVYPSEVSRFEPVHLGRIAVVRTGVETDRRTAAVYEHDRQLHVLAETGSGDLLGSEGFDPGAIAVPEPSGAVRVFDPWLVEVATQLVLFYAVEDEDGLSHLERTTGPAGFTTDFALGTALVMPDPGGEIGSEIWFDAPTVWLDGTTWRMIARAHRADGPAVLVQLESDDGAVFTYLGGTLASATVLSPALDDLFAFDRDELDGPALIVRDGVTGTRRLELYYAARRGTRWSIGLAVSVDGTHWRRVGPILEGRQTGFDAFSVNSPAPLMYEDGSVDLIYRGTDGSEAAYGRATRL